MDWKSRAAGETDEPLQSKSKPITEQSTNQPSREYIAALLFRLEGLSGRSLTADELEIWIQELSRYPATKLKMLEAYHGPLNSKLFEELDKPSPPAIYSKHEILSLPEPQKGKVGIARDCRKWISKFVDAVGTGDKERIATLKTELTETMNKKYPQYKWGW